MFVSQSFFNISGPFASLKATKLSYLYLLQLIQYIGCSTVSNIILEQSHVDRKHLQRGYMKSEVI